jgi:predicted transcriptional regulator
MAQAVSVRLDEEAMRALAQLEATGQSRSAAIRRALVETASRLSDKETLAAEMAGLEADEDDRAEMKAVAELMESLRAAG